MSATATGYLASKPRYEILDGLRGVAAMIVVAFHLLETYSKGPAYQVLNHGYLAVDFFFVLSGFVIGYAYDDRWNRMSLKGFFKRRLVRLHPMVIMGSLIGALFFYFGSAAFPMIAGVQWWEVLLICLLGCTMLPALPSWDIRGWGETSPLNGPAWSLLYEYIANILYALVIRRFPKFVLGLFVAGAGHPVRLPADRLDGGPEAVSPAPGRWPSARSSAKSPSRSTSPTTRWSICRWPGWPGIPTLRSARAFS